MREFIITAADDGVRLNRYLQKCVPAMTAGAMYKFLRKKSIKRNGKRCEASDRLMEGDVLQLYIDDSFFVAAKKQPEYMKAGAHLEVVYEDEGLLIVAKPAGLLVHSDTKEHGDTLVGRILRYLAEKGEYSENSGTGFTPAVCNRLDRGTQGLVLAAKNARVLAAVNEAIRERHIEKQYLCLTAKPVKTGVYEGYLTKNEADNRVTFSKDAKPGAKPITTGFETLAQKGGLCLVRADLITGRTHQIRAHLAHLGAPIAGDLKYGSPALNKRLGLSRQALCAWRLAFTDALEGSPLSHLIGRTFEVPAVWFKDKYFGE